MSEKDLARRASSTISFAGTDITKDCLSYLISLTYTDNEEDSADDLQLKFHDRDDIWLTKWMNNLMETYASVSAKTVITQNTVTTTTAGGTYAYKVNYSIGVWVRNGPGTNYATHGAFGYGASVNCYCKVGSWMVVQYGTQFGYSWASYLTAKGNAAPTYVQVGYGSSGNSVRSMQTMLKKLGYSLGSYGVDGSFGSATRTAVRNFQSAVGISVDGVCGPITWGWLCYKYGIATGSTKTTTTTSTSTDFSYKGMPITATITRENMYGDGKDATLKCGDFELDSLTHDGPPGTITIKGTSLFYSSSIRQTEKSKIWEKYYLSGIAKEIASNGNMGIQLYLHGNDRYYASVEQSEQSDIEFLSELCHKAGVSLKIYDNNIILFDQAYYEAKAAIRTFTRGDGSYTKWKLSTSEADTKYDYCRVYYTDATTKKVYTVYAFTDDYDDNESHNLLSVNERVSSYAEARSLAMQMLKMKNKFEYSVSLTIPGDPDMVSGACVELKSWGAFTGKYIIKQSKHTFGGNAAYTTQLSLRKAATTD